MFALPNCDYEINPVVEKALNLFLILHADHGQNCSTSTARTVGSSEANLFGSIASAVSALWGVRHGGANMAVIKMLEDIYQAGCSIDDYIEKAKNKESGCKLMGFGHRVYKNFDPRAKVLKQYVDKVLKELKIHDPLLDIARRLEEKALSDPYFVRRKLYPNVDFYSGILLSALGIPVNMFTVMFAMGRIPGWIAHWKEVHEHGQRIYRPRQIYTGSRERDYVPMEQR
jgi:citrate synthase